MKQLPSSLVFKMQWQEVPHKMLLTPSVILFIVTISHTILPIASDQSPSQANVPPGYYAFPTTNRRIGSPPKVKPPPYLPTDIPCPGSVNNGFIAPAKETLCGDLNKSFIPRNPMGQMVDGQPYPFQLIMNKTLVYLARSLPFLKEDLDNIPKVVKLAKPSHQQLQQQQVQQRQQQQQQQQLHSPYYEYEHVKRRSARDVQGQSVKGRSNLLNSAAWNLTESRTKSCEQKDGLMCQLVNSLSGNGLLSQAAQVISAAQTAATTAQNIGSIASLLHQLSSPSTDQSPKSMISQLANILTGDVADAGTSSPSPSSSLSTATSSAPASGTSNFNPVIAVLDYLASNSQEKSGGISTLLPARRKKPADLEELASEAAAVTSSLNTNRVPPTPCPSVEEYIAPVFARNYQGVWKYIVQIPHEGYFTQTVQKTSCIKTKCDFMDGSCHESPRWVSLLVAEIFYPDARLPTPSVNPHLESFLSTGSIVGTKQQPQPQSQQSQQQQPQTQMHHTMKAPASIHNSLARSMVSSSDWVPKQPVAGGANNKLNSNNQSYNSNSNRVAREVPSETTGDQVDTKKVDTRECDGTDAIGCYTVRVYYDWFLVPGSCKCWKKQGSFDALKKYFTGK